MHGKKIFKAIYMLTSLKHLVLFPLHLRRIIIIAKEKSYYNDLPRKTPLKRVIDNLGWYLKYQEINYNYNSYGLDIKKKKNKDYISNRQFIYIRDYYNQYNTAGHYNSIAILRDKLIFSLYFSFYLADKVADYIAIYKGNTFFSPKFQKITLNDLLIHNEALVFKKNDGECGNNIFFLKKIGSLYLINNKMVTLDDFESLLGTSTYIVQKILPQHPSISEINPYCVNTIRLVTIITNGSPRFFCAFLRLGTNIDSPLDNRTLGGLGVGINHEGYLSRYGIANSKFGQIYAEHPITGTKFENRLIPFWSEAVELAINAHKLIDSIKSIGWDIVITPNCPIILEGNDNWEIAGPQDTSGGLKHLFLDNIRH